MDMDAGRGEFFGNPVEVVSSRGEMRAPHVIYTSADQLVHAVEGVHAIIRQASDANLTGSVLGEGKGPVMVQSAEAYWQRPQATFIFRGDVRAWRGDNLLLAPELQGERLPQGDQLAASGGVKTVWLPGQQEESAPAPGAAPGAAAGRKAPAAATANPRGASAPGSGGGGARAASRPAAVGTAAAAPATGTAASGKAAAGKVAAGKAATETATGAGKGGGGAITVLAANMLYRDGSGVLTYTGNVHVDQDGKTLTCKQLDVNLDQDHKAKQMTCTGGTHLDDPAAGRKIDGETGVYRLETRKIDVFGNPVVMRDRDGNLVHGKRLRYALDDGKVEVLGKDEVKPPAPASSASPTSPAPTASSGSPPDRPLGEAPKSSAIAGRTLAQREAGGRSASSGRPPTGAAGRRRAR
jgi:lipopolysaccharide transport protein LptA